MCNQWLIAQPASVQRPVKLYSSHPISDRLHFKNCLLEEGHTHTHRWNTLSDTQGKQGRAYTFEPLQNSHKPHFISGSHAIATHKQPPGLSGLLWFPPHPSTCPDQMFTIWNSRGRKKDAPSYKDPSGKRLPLDPGVRQLWDPASPRPRLQRALLCFMGFNDMHRHTPGPASQSI